MPPVIKVERLGKRYTIMASQERQRSFRDAMREGAKRALRRLRGRAAPRREEFWALKDVSFEIQQGERVGIIGRNGAGKSTLLKILSRITEPTEGRICTRGRIASLLEVGTGFHPELTGRENVFMNGAILGMSAREIKKRFDEIVAFAEIEKFIDTPVKRYSSGMHVRLAFSVSAHLDSEILVVDEVLAVGDAGFRRKCLEKMQQTSLREGRTIVLVSHNMSTITAVCDRAVLLSGGRMVADGPVADVAALYLGTGQSSTYEEDKDLPRAMVRRAWLEDAVGTRRQEFSAGEPVILVMEVENRERQPLETKIEIRDSLQRQLSVFTHAMYGLGPLPTCEKILARVEFSLPPLSGKEIRFDVVLRPYQSREEIYRTRESLRCVLVPKAGILPGNPEWPVLCNVKLDARPL